MAKKLWSLDVINIRDAALDKHKTVDDTPYGGGTGMLIKPDVLAKSIDENVKIEIEFFIFHQKVKYLIKNLLNSYLKKNHFL